MEPNLAGSALVTGASSGIGKAFAQLLAADGVNLILTARRLQRLEELKQELQERHGVEVMVIGEDLADSSAPRRLIEQISGAGKEVGVLVNNAGYGLPGNYVNTKWEDQAALVQVMVTSLCELTHRLLPGMVKRRYGRIINVASIAGLLPGSSSHTLYGAAKSFVVKFTESLWLELEGTGVNVTALCPGFTMSEFHDVTGTRAKVSKLPAFMWMDAETVARQGIQAVMKGEMLCVNGRFNRFLTVGSKHIPHRVGMSLSRSQSKHYRNE
jgi:uncharacterized protein